MLWYGWSQTPVPFQPNISFGIGIGDHAKPSRRVTLEVWRKGWRYESQQSSQHSNFGKTQQGASSQGLTLEVGLKVESCFSRRKGRQATAPTTVQSLGSESVSLEGETGCMWTESSCCLLEKRFGS